MYLVGVSLTVPSRSCLFSQFYFVNIQCFAGNSLVQQYYFQQRPDESLHVGIISTAWKTDEMQDHNPKAQCSQFRESASVELCLSRTLCLACMLIKDSPSSIPYRVSNLLFRRKIKILLLKMFYSSVRNQRDLSRVEKITSS